MTSRCLSLISYVQIWGGQHTCIKLEWNEGGIDAIGVYDGMIVASRLIDGSWMYVGSWRQVCKSAVCGRAVFILRMNCMTFNWYWLKYYSFELNWTYHAVIASVICVTCHASTLHIDNNWQIVFILSDLRQGGLEYSKTRMRRNLDTWSHGCFLSLLVFCLVCLVPGVTIHFFIQDSSSQCAW